MDPQKQREIASKGGKAAHEKGTAHEFTSEEARVAGKKGGAASRARRGKTDSDHGDTMTTQPSPEGSEPAMQ
jgi:general stress protein YciG